jgi:hypothetical protein
VLGLGASEAGDSLYVVGEAGSAFQEERADKKGFGAQCCRELRFFNGLLGEGVGEPVGRLADIEGDGGGVGGDDPARSGAVSRRPGWMRRDATPANGSGETECIKVAGIVVGDAGGQEAAFPLAGGGFEAFELVKRLEDTFFSAELGLRSEMLPVEKPSQVNRRSDGFDLLAEGTEGEAVDALEDSALAPLDLVVFSGRGVFEGSAHEKALHLYGEEGLEDSGGIESQAGGEG